MEEGEGMDSLFEGMVLFTPSQLDDTARDDQQQQEAELEDGGGGGENDDDDDDASRKYIKEVHPMGIAQPLDENLFSDLTLVHSSDIQPDPTTSSINGSITSGTTSAATRQIVQSGRKKKRAAGLRIGYARDDLPPSTITARSSYQDDDDAAAVNYSESSASREGEKDSSTPPTSTPIGESQSHAELEILRSEIHAKLNRARELSASVSASRKEFIRRRRKAADDLNSASASLGDLESQLEDACEREDFDSAERIADAFKSAEAHQQSLLTALKEAEADCDAIESQMHQALHSQITAEEHCASLLRLFAQDAEKNADIILNNAKAHYSNEMADWFSSSEALEAKKIELDVESHFLLEARWPLSNSIDLAIETDLKEKEYLCKKKDTLAAELQHLLSLVRDKEKEIAENDHQIKAAEDRITDVVSGFQQTQSSIDCKYDSLQAALSQMELQSEASLNRREEIEEMLTEEEVRGTKLRELARVSEEEAKSYEEVVELRKSLHLSISKSREDKARLAEAEEKLTQDVHALQQEVLAARASLQDLSSTKSKIQQEVSSFRQRIFFIDKRDPELEAEKKLAAAARNFKEAARIAGEAKSLSVEKDVLQIDLEKSTMELEKLEEVIVSTVEQLQETEGLILAKEKKVAKARYQRLLLIAGVATAERVAALGLGDMEEANLLLTEAEAASAEAKKFQAKYEFKEEDFADLPKHFISLELVSNLGGKQLAQLAASIDLSAS